jgi:hypothetical protein
VQGGLFPQRKSETLSEISHLPPFSVSDQLNAFSFHEPISFTRVHSFPKERSSALLQAPFTETMKHIPVFDPFRFSDMRAEGGQGVKHHLVTTHPDYIPFGHGRHAWLVLLFCRISCRDFLIFILSWFCSPGRFFAANELEAMLAYVGLNYDIKLENEGVRPDCWVGSTCVPNPTAEIMIRKRESLY